MEEPPPLSREEVERVIAALEPLAQERRIVLIGGQAVALWASFFKLPEASDDKRIYTSKDIDFEGAARSARKAGDILRGKVRIPDMDDHTPNTGLVTFIDADGFERTIDFLGAPGGLSASDVRKTAVRLFVAGPGGEEVPIWVINPERCMESRIYNVMELNQRGEVAMDQLRRSILCAAKEWARYLLASENLGPLVRARSVLKLNERIFNKCVRDRRSRDLYLDYAMDPFDAVINEDGLPKNFREKRYPQMVEMLEVPRQRDVEHRRTYGHKRPRSSAR